jgi:hypothetical protein
MNCVIGDVPFKKKQWKPAIINPKGKINTLKSIAKYFRFQASPLSFRNPQLQHIKKVYSTAQLGSSIAICTHDEVLGTKISSTPSHRPEC